MPDFWYLHARCFAATVNDGFLLFSVRCFAARVIAKFDNAGFGNSSKLTCPCQCWICECQCWIFDALLPMCIAAQVHQCHLLPCHAAYPLPPTWFGWQCHWDSMGQQCIGCHCGSMSLEGMGGIAAQMQCCPMPSQWHAVPCRPMPSQYYANPCLPNGMMPQCNASGKMVFAIFGFISK